MTAVPSLLTLCFVPILHFNVSSARYLLPVFQSSLSQTDTFGTGPDQGSI